MEYRFIGLYSFAHALIRETLYSALSAPRRARLHRQSGGVIEEISRAAQESPVVALAYHFFQAARGGYEVEQAVTYAARAGEHAMAMLAYEDAASYYTNALQALSLKPLPDEWRSCELLLALGEAHRKAGDVTQAQDTFLRAVEQARILRAREAPPQAAALLARAALGFSGDWWGRFGVGDRHLVELLEVALDALGASESVLRVRVTSQLAMALAFVHHQERGAVLSQQAIEIARRFNDRTALALALNSRHWVLWARGGMEERLAVATEIVRLADAEGNREFAFFGRVWRLIDLLESGEIAALDEEFAAFAELTAALRQPSMVGSYVSSRAGVVRRALRGGRAERLAQQAAVVGQRVQDQTAVQAVLFAQLQVLRLEQGRLWRRRAGRGQRYCC